MNVEATLVGLVDRFNRHVARHPGIAEELARIERTIEIRFTDGPTYAVDLARSRLENLRTSAADRADLRITTDQATFEQLVRKELGPMKAIVTGRLRLDGSLEDKLLLRRLL